MTLKTSAQSSAVRHMGPILSMVQLSAMAPNRLTRPKVGRSPVTPQRLEGEIFDLLNAFNTRMTILVVSHDIAFISSYVGRVACINRTLVCHGTDAVDGQVIQDLYGEDVRMIAHRH